MGDKIKAVAKNYSDVMLDEHDIQAIINGEKIYKVTPKGERISISQSLLVGAMAPVVNYENQVVSQTEINNKVTVAEQNTAALMENIVKNMNEGIAINQQTSMRFSS